MDRYKAKQQSVSGFLKFVDAHIAADSSNNKETEGQIEDLSN